MVKLPAPERGTDNRDGSGAPRHSPTTYRRHLCVQLRAGSLACFLMAAREVAVPYRNRRRVLATQRVQIEQRYRPIFGPRRYSAVCRALVEFDRHPSPEWTARFMGTNVFHRLRAALEA